MARSSDNDYFSVNNWDKFQHYKKRHRPPWIKLYNSLLEDYEFTCLQDVSKAHLFAIFLLASRYHNKIPWDETWLAKAISATSKVSLDTLETAGFITRIPNENNGASKVLASCKQSATPDIDIDIDIKAMHETSNSDLKRFWETYPKTTGAIKIASERWDTVVKPLYKTNPEIGAEILSSLKAQIAHKAEMDRRKEFCAAFPFAEKWLKERRWENLPETPTQERGFVV